MNNRPPLFSRWAQLTPVQRELAIVALALFVPGAVIWRVYFTTT